MTRTLSQSQSTAVDVPLGIIAHGYEAAAAATTDGWVAVAMLIPNADDEFVESMNWIDGPGVTLRPGKSREQWAQRVGGAKRRVIWWTGDDKNTSPPRELAAADRVFGIAAAGPKPAVTWCQCEAGRWTLKLHTQQGTSSIVESDRQLSSPALAWIDGSPWLACEESAAGFDIVVLRGADGKPLAKVTGRGPQLLADPRGGGVLLVHRMDSPESFVIDLYRIDQGKLAQPVTLPSVDDYNLMAHAAFDETDGSLYVVHETCPSWGYDEAMGGYRELAVWRWPRGGKPQPAPGTARAALPVFRGSFWDNARHNFTYVNPRIVVRGGAAVVTYRQFRYEGQKGFRFDLCAMRLVDGQWSDAQRVQVPPGLLEPRYALLPTDDASCVTVIVPCTDGKPAVTLDNVPTGGLPIAENLRIEAHRCDMSMAAELAPVPSALRDAYQRPPSIKNACPPPPEVSSLAKVTGGMRLVWADLHVHSSSSKCMGDQDGTPANVLSMQRDVLGCDVLCLTDHAEHLLAPEHLRTYDELERAAAGRLPVIYGTEPYGEPAHNINYYTMDRGVFEKLREIAWASTDERERFRRIREELPKDSVSAMRHNHGCMKGEFAVHTPGTLKLFDARVESGMEAMQTRGNVMLTKWHANEPGGICFPNNFLDHGAHVALVGGSDHSHGSGPNHFCLTGFWVKELSAAAVWEALLQRRTIATANGKIALWVDCDGQPMGGLTKAAGPVRFTVHLSAGRPVRRVYLLRDGQPLESVKVDATTATVELVDENPSAGEHWYIVTAEGDSVFTEPMQTHRVRLTGKWLEIPKYIEPPVVAHASPIRITVRK